MSKKQPKQLDLETQRRFLKFINDAQHPRDLAIPIKALEKNVLRVRRPREDNLNINQEGKDEDVKLAMDEKMARKIIDARNECSPVYGFLNIEQMFEIIDFNFNDWWFNWICILLGFSRNGSWQKLDYQSTVKVAQAALMHTPDDDHKGRVLLIEQVFGNTSHEADYSRTPLWKPEGTTEANAFEENSPHPPGLSPAVAHNTFLPSVGNVYCSDHAFLSDGSLLAVGGGGELGPPPAIANMAWIFDPKLKEWHPTYDKSAGHGSFETMNFGRWYPTAISLGDDSGRVLIVGGRGDGEEQMEVYNEHSGLFSLISGPPGEDPDPSESPITWDYPNLHLLRNGQIFYSRALRNSEDAAPALFSFDTHDTGRWSVLTGPPVTTSSPGSSSALILGDAGEPDRVIHVGGTKGGPTSNAVRVIEVPPTSSTPWQIYPFPDGYQRRRANLVLLPDGTVLIAGGAEGVGTGKECYLFDPAQTGSNPFTKVADMSVSRNATHNQVMLLPDARIVTFGTNREIEIFTPPYLYNAQCQLADRPEITDWPNPDTDHHIHHGQTFSVHSPQAADIGRVVLVRPMSVTHQMDTEQRVLPLCFTYRGGDDLEILVPDGRVYPYSSNTHTHAIAPRGMYMLFILDNNGVPSKAKFVLLK
ncbi:hypothetical protein MNBD_GAMMA21-1907 [hydrothermal vent metagenome]|uniref:Galactose oxidase-like Early set domain-containing protein n=1 Tax=hydrothermal vent metagenome TaxID=652676 RepID=A0A3B0ZWA0_9ZZZZ